MGDDHGHRRRQRPARRARIDRLQPAAVVVPDHPAGRPAEARRAEAGRHHAGHRLGDPASDRPDHRRARLERRPVGIRAPAPRLRSGRHRSPRRPPRPPLSGAHPHPAGDRMDERCAGAPPTPRQRDDTGVALGRPLAVPVRLRHDGPGHRSRLRDHRQRDQLGHARPGIALRQRAPARRLGIAPAAPVIPAPGDALFLALAAHPINPLAPAVLIVVAVLMAAGDTAGQLAANERLFRLATGPGVLAFQSHFVIHNVGAYAGGVAASSMIMLLGGYPAFAILFVAAGLGRFTAARVTEVTVPARHPRVWSHMSHSGRPPLVREATNGRDRTASRPPVAAPASRGQARPILRSRSALGRRRRNAFRRDCICVIAQVLRYFRDGSTSTTDVTRAQAASIARALADPKRLCVLEQLADGERSVSDLSRDVGCQVPNMSQHLSVLRTAGLVASRREGNTVFYRLADERVLDAYRLLQQVAG